MLFDEIENGIVEKELNMQKQYIKDEIVKLEKNMNKEYKQLKTRVINYNLVKFDKLSQISCKPSSVHSENLLQKPGIQSDYQLNQLPKDNVNGFNGKDEYDNQGYLTKLLMAAHQIGLQ